MTTVVADPMSAWENQELTHMPFLCREPAGRRYLLVFARSRLRPRRTPQYGLFGTMRVWRLAWTRCLPRVGRADPVQPFHTGLGPFEVECCPCVSMHAGEVHVSFIGSNAHGTGTLRHHLYKMSGPTLDRLGPAVRAVPEECVSGFWRPDLTAVWNGKDRVIRLTPPVVAGLPTEPLDTTEGLPERQGAVNRRETFGQVPGGVGRPAPNLVPPDGLIGRGETRLETDFEEIGRVSFDPENLQHLLITGVLPGALRVLDGLPQAHTVVYDLGKDKVLGEILASGSPAYKPSYCGDLLATVQPGPAARRESWKIALSEQLTLGPTRVVVRHVK